MSSISLASFTARNNAMTTTIFMMMPCCPTCEVIPAYYDCDGNELESIEYEDFGDQTLIWKLPSSVCG